jgi:hypothetical protein
MPRVGRSFAPILLIAACALAAPRAAESRDFAAGMPLTEALQELRSRGLKLVFSSAVVRPEMVVKDVPRAATPRAILDELLVPQGLAVEEQAGGSLVVVAAPRPRDPPAIHGTARSRAPLFAREDVFVYPSRITVMQEEPAPPLAFDGDDVRRLPHLGTDVFRTISLLPGTTSDDVSAQFHVRGGRRDEVLVLLDGQELYEAYHLKDFDNALSLVAASGLSNVDLTTGAFPSSYGDRMGGILDLTTVTPSKPRQFRLSVSVLNAQLEGNGTLGDRAWWLASVRRGTTELADRLFGAEEPVYWDAFAKLDYRPADSQSIRVNALRSGDELNFDENKNEEVTHLDTSYDNTYVWLTHQLVLGSLLFVDTAVSGSRVARDRRGLEDEDEKNFVVRDQRDLSVFGVQQSWNLQTGDRNFLRAGLEFRRYDASYDYSSFREFVGPLALVSPDSREGALLLHDRFVDDHFGGYVSDRFRPLDGLTLEVGARYDRHSLTEDSVWSPRVNAAWAVGRGSALRAGWGWYYQSHRAYELLVEDGDTTFYPAERSEHWVVGFEHVFDAGDVGPLTGFRAEAYRRSVTDPRPRYESLFAAFERFPEGDPARVRVEPQSAYADGIELAVQGRAGSRIDWWFNYGWSTTKDRIDGQDVPRSFDQRHAFNIDVNYRLGRSWDVNLAWRFHTGWPTTPIALAAENGELVPVLGPRNSERLPLYHRLDARVSRRWNLGSALLSTFVDVQNVYNRRNTAGFDVEIDEARGEVISNIERWPGIFASAGVSLEF